MSKEPKYQVLDSFGKIEIRFYQPFLVAEVESSGLRREAIRSGFRILAGYIFGNNKSSTKLPMSIPVTQQRTENGWKIRFMITNAFDLEDLPHPNNSEIKLLKVPEQKMAVIRFSGSVSEENLEKYTKKLQAFATLHEWVLDEKPIYAFYNPPWTLPFLRRNEVIFEILS